MTWQSKFLNDLEERSLYAVLCIAFLEWHPSPSELTSAFKGVRKLTPVLSLSDAALKSISNVLGLEAVAVLRAAGSHLSPQGAGCLLRSELRYCPACLGRCWHSVLFQHWGVSSCPIHSVDLRTGCPSCGRPIELNLATLSRSPFSCDKCGETFVEYRDWDSRAGGPDSEPFKPWHAGLSIDLTLRTSSRRCAVWANQWRTTHVPTSGQSIRISRNIWWNRPIASLVRPRDFTVEIRRSDGEPSTSVAMILVEIEAGLRKQGLYASPPPTFGGTRSSHSMPVVAAAFWKTVNFYLSPIEFIRRRERAAGLSAVEGDLPYDWPEACALLLRAEVTSFMVRQILASLSLKHLAEIDWPSELHPEQFAPAWLLEQSSKNRASLTVRPVSSSRALTWLFRRVGNRLLKPSHFDRDLGTLVDSKDAHDER
jgi:hypothetical protein